MGPSGQRKAQLTSWYGAPISARENKAHRRWLPLPIRGPPTSFFSGYGRCNNIEIAVHSHTPYARYISQLPSPESPSRRLEACPMMPPEASSTPPTSAPGGESRGPSPCPPDVGNPPAESREPRIPEGTKRSPPTNPIPMPDSSITSSSGASTSSQQEPKRREAVIVTLSCSSRVARACHSTRFGTDRACLDLTFWSCILVSQVPSSWEAHWEPYKLGDDL